MQLKRWSCIGALLACPIIAGRIRRLVRSAGTDMATRREYMKCEATLQNFVMPVDPNWECVC
jgi:hypothetical protein